MIAEYNDSCRECGDGITKGDEVHFANRTITCLDCGPSSPDASRGSSTGMEDAPGYVRALIKRIDGLQDEVKRLDLAVGQTQRIMLNLVKWAAKLSTELEIEPPEITEQP